MQYFYSGGGNPNPDFVYRFSVKAVPDEMYKWCERYPLTGPFERWYIKHNTGNFERDTVIQFESKKAAFMFSIAYSEYIIENKSIYSLKD